MWIKELKLYNIQGYEETKLEFAKNINVLIGANNSGKSTIIKSLYRLQVPYVVNRQNIRKGCDYGEIKVLFADSSVPHFARQDKNGEWFLPEAQEHYTVMRIYDNDLTSFFYDAQYDKHASFPMGVMFQLNDKKGNSFEYSKFESFQQSEPRNFIYPFLSKRRKSHYEDRTDIKTSFNVPDDLGNLSSKISQLVNPSHAESEKYIKTCKEILGFGVGNIPGHNGYNIGIYTSQNDMIPLETMGEGVANILGLLAILHTDKNKLFLIEELENDVHPAALKKLLKVIIEKSKENQFIISTHSNIVAKYLGSVPGNKLFQTSWEIKDQIPTSAIKEVEKTPEAKRKVLEDLGYELYDYSLWEGYLILEESSAEVIIREFLIPWFTPGLNGRLRTVSANGVGKVEPAFEDFRRLFLFTHLEPSYKNKAWVIVDGEPEGVEVIQKLKSAFCKAGWKDSSFHSLSKHDFEEYYPAKFQKEVSVALDMRGSGNKQKKREAKKSLVEKVKKWARSNESEAQKAFAKSAKEIIDLLKIIENQLSKK
jgi:AAA15 family ATPase/GTPase